MGDGLTWDILYSMAHLEANPTLSVLIWARESSGLDADLAAKKAGISADRLRAWESGRQKPTFTLSRCAAYSF